MKCRLCLAKCNQEKCIALFNNDEESNLIKVVAKYLFIEITQLDLFSTMICEDCLKHINEFHKFFLYVEQQQKTLKNDLLKTKCFTVEQSSCLFVAPNGQYTALEHNDESLLDIKDVIDEDETCVDRSTLVDELGYADKQFDMQAQKNFTESDEEMPLLSLFKKTEKSTSKIRSTKLNKNQTRAKRKYTRTEHKAVETELKDIDNSDNSCLLKEKQKSKHSLITLEENELQDKRISEYMLMKCEICNECLASYNDLRKHFRKEHNEQAYIICCGTRYMRRFQLYDHIQSHLNPNRFRCEICQKILKSRSSLKLHMANMHIDRNEMKHACHLCNKKFPYLSVLNSHMVVHTDEMAHACEICGKGFKTNYMLKMHFKHVHDKKTPFMCETCGKEYRFKLSFERHVAEHQGRPNEPTEQCTICGQWLRYNCLRKHMQRHQIQTFECEFCKKICKSKSALTSHIDYCHKKKHIHTCTLCDKSFKRKIRLQEHIAMHTGKKDYHCSHCPREFRSKANMYVHIKKMHVEEWTQTQIARNRGPTELAA